MLCENLLDKILKPFTLKREPTDIDLILEQHFKTNREIQAGTWKRITTLADGTIIDTDTKDGSIHVIKKDEVKVFP